MQWLCKIDQTLKQHSIVIMTDARKKKRNSNHDLLRICSPPERETDADQGEDE
jgi:hypothetical protein